MKIAIISTSCYRKIGGVAQFTWQLAQEYIKKGHDVHIFTLFDYRDTYDLPTSSIVVHRIKVPRLSMYEFNNIDVKSSLFKQVLNIFKLAIYFVKLTVSLLKVRPDVIQTNSIMDAIPAFVSKVIFRTPYTITFHLNLGNKDSNALGNQRISSLVRNVMRYFPQLIFTDRIISLTKESHDGILQVLGKESDIIPNGVDVNIFKPDFSKRTSLDLSIEIVSVGMLYPVKGFNYAIVAMQDVCPQFPQSHYTIIGDGPQYDEYKLLIKSLGLQERITLVGKLPHHDVASLLQKSHIFLMPSLSEGFPLVLLEAMACGLPIISTPVSSAPDIINKWSNGYIVPFKSPNEIASAITQIIHNDEVNVLSAQSLRASQEYTWTSVSEKYLEVFADVLLHE